MAEASAVVVHEMPVSRSARVAIMGGPGADESWLVLHGYGQLAERFLRSFQPVTRPGRLIIAPEALSRFYTSREPSRVGATWMTREARESEIRDYLAYLDAVVEQFAPASGSLQVHGFSQGTATAIRWAAHTDRPIARLVLWGGGVPPEVDLAALHARQPGMRWDFCVGRSDEFITEELIATETDRVRQAAVPFNLHRFEGGHEVHEATLLDLARDA